MAKAATAKAAAPKGGATKAAAKKGGGQKSGRSMGWLHGLLCGVAVMLAPPTGLLLGVLLAPGLGALLMDDRPAKPLARTMLLFGLAASVNPVRQLWGNGHGMTVALSLLSQPAVLAMAWMAGGFGWLLTQLVPLTLTVALDLRTREQQARLRRMRKQLETEWGLPPPAGGN